MIALRSFNVVFAGLLLPILSACNATTVDSDLVKVSMVSGQNCEIAKFADIPIQISGNHILMPIEIDGSERLFILDTGAQTSTVTPEFAQSAGLEATGRKTRTVGIGGATITADVSVPIIKIGGFGIHNTSMVTAVMMQPPAPAPQAVGIIGQPILQAFDVEVDLPHRRVALYAPKHCADGFLPWGAPFTVSKAEITKRGIVVPALLDGKSLPALIDTGAATTILSDGGLQDFGVSIETVLKEPAIRVTGAGGRSSEMHVHRFSRLSVGGAFIDHPRLLVGEIAAPARIIVGLDFMAKFRVWISYATNQVFLAAPGPGS